MRHILKIHRSLTDPLPTTKREYQLRTFDPAKDKERWLALNNKIFANHPDQARSTWDRLQKVMAPGALDPMVKELIYMAVSISNQCEYCIHSHTASARHRGMTDEMYSEFLAVVGMASQTNAMATAMQVPVDPCFLRENQGS